MDNRKFRQQALHDALATRIVVLDGAMGSILHSQLTIADYGGSQLEKLHDNVCRTRPDLIASIHRQYFEAGAHIVETNSFNGHPLSLAEFQIEEATVEINRAAARIAREVADEYWTTRCRVSSPVPWADDTFDHGHAKRRLRGVAGRLLHPGEGADRRRRGHPAFGNLQTTRANVKAALLGIERLERELGMELPGDGFGTIEPTGTMLAGQTADAFYASIGTQEPVVGGLNCATGPEFMTDHIRTLHQMAKSRISCYPNAGLPNEEMKYLETPEKLAGNWRNLSITVG
jgi:5-methyltetrahydrofolate--homocysteine methyltransferase